MKRLIITLLILTLSVWLGVKLTPGYVSITRGHWIIELPLWLAVIGLLMGFILLHYLVRFGSMLLYWPSRLRAYYRRIRQRRAEALYTQTLLDPLYKTSRDWRLVLRSLPQLQKKNLISEQQSQPLRRQSYQALLIEATQKGPASVLQQTWCTIPHRWQQDSTILLAYVNGLIQYGQHDQAESLVRKALQKAWDSQLAKSYGLIQATKSERQLKIAEQWLSHHAKDANLLLSLGRVCARMQLWGKAQDYFTASLAYGATTETYHALAKLFEQLGKPQVALQYYKKSALDSLPNS